MMNAMLIDDTRAARARSRSQWPVHVKQLDEPEFDDLSGTTTPEQRFLMVWPLTLEAWRVAGLAIPEYVRAEAPTRLLTLVELRQSERAR